MPMPESPVTWEAVLNRAAEMLKTQPANLPAEFAGICSEGTRQAWIDVYGALSGKGYGPANIMAADQLKHYVLARGAVLSILACSALCTYDLSAIKFFDPIGEYREKVAFMAITVNGEPVAPQPQESQVGGVSSGRLQAWDEEARRYDRKYGGGCRGGSNDWFN